MASSVTTATGNVWVSVGSGHIMGTLTNASVTAWIKPAGNSGISGGAIYSERAASGNDIWKFQTSNNLNATIEFTHRDDAGTLNQPQGSSTNLNLGDGNWHHVAMTKSGTSITLYHNGRQTGAVATLTGTDTLTNASTSAKIGGDVADANAFFNGGIDEVILFNVALSATNIAALYSKNTLPSGGVSGWHFDENTGTFAADFIGSNTGTLANSSMWSTSVPVNPAPGFGFFSVF